MKKTIKSKFQTAKSTVKQAILMGSISIISHPALADLPTMQAATRGNGSGIMDTIKNYAYDGVVLGGLLIAAFGFTKVAGALIEGYGEVAAGKKKWGDLGALALVGAVMLVVIIWLLVEAAKIL
ncbi:TIGR03745 family integrating conjugative element membrane protein [Pasteurella skyensis]|uniref:TIGR03745 family integrating conjugative element membrane protein n=1 Tax=Phocoenobacter skyensis TaxID=97481 RepID=UPI002774336E|nr:TIGR03745 family integrating conjugative element membrane protein [Pasteurella skyensis]MDP8189072.1 TIGR03745 family integrating conjugative element membrane protein [Pasteurella skyensis]